MYLISVLRLIKRLTPWPIQISEEAFKESCPQSNVTLKCERMMRSKRKLRAQLVTQTPTVDGLTSFHSIVPDSNFPCMNAGGGRSGDANTRHTSPFTQTIRTYGVDVMYLSCVAYFEVHLEPTFGTENVSMSVGLANPNFPQTQKLGGDVNSFGYFSHDGHLYHGDDTVGIHFGPSYSTDDVIGCGLVYPPLAADQGEIFFTRNGEIIGVVELLDVGQLDVPWYPIVGLNCEQKVEFNYGDDEFRFPILDFEAEELKNRWGNICMEATIDRDVYCVRVYNQLLNQSISQCNSSDAEGADESNSMSLQIGDSGVNSHQQYDSYGQVIEYPAATMSHRQSSSIHGSNTSKVGTLSQVKSQTLHTVVHEIPIRKGKRKFEEEGEDAGDPVRYQRFKTWTQGESAGSWAGSSVNDSWEDDNLDGGTEIPLRARKSLPRRDSDRTLSSLGDNQSIDETQSCIAVEGEMTLAEYLQMADAGIEVGEDGDVGRRMGMIGEDIDNDGRGCKPEEEDEAEVANDASDVSDDERSIATSLFVEVASVDGCGSYFGYGGSSDSDNEVQEYYDCDQDDRASSGYISGGPHSCLSRQGQTSSPQNSNSEGKSSGHRHRYRSKYRDRNSKSNDSNSSHRGIDTSPQLEEQILRSSAFTRNTPLVTSKWTEDGYDAASETGRGDLTDGMEDNVMDEDAEEMDDDNDECNSTTIRAAYHSWNRTSGCGNGSNSALNGHESAGGTSMYNLQIHPSNGATIPQWLPTTHVRSLKTNNV